MTLPALQVTCGTPLRLLGESLWVDVWGVSIFGSRARGGGGGLEILPVSMHGSRVVSVVYICTY